MESPLIYEELEDVELKAQFKDMMGDSGSEEEVLAFLERVRLKVTANPLLARIVENHISLLDSTLMITDENYVLDDAIYSYVHTVKCVIDANPSALLWKMHYEYPINVISGHPQLCSLMPWIAANHQWILDHGSITDKPPLIELIRLYKGLSDSATSRGIAETIRQLIEIYPQSLLSQHSSDVLLPLHVIITCPGFEVDLVKKMVELCPSSVMAKSKGGLTPLHVACLCVAKVSAVPADNLTEICKHLISECPESVRCATIRSVLPIHLLLGSSQHPTVREVILCMLRAYPESYDIPFSASIYNIPMSDRLPSSFPFIQHANTLLVEERALQDNIDQLQLIPGAFDNAVKCTRDDLIKSTSTVFNNWAKSSIQAIESKIDLNSSLIKHACDYYQTNVCGLCISS